MSLRVNVDKESYIMAHAQEALALIDETEGLMADLDYYENQYEESLGDMVWITDDECVLPDAGNPKYEEAVDKLYEINCHLADIAEKYALFRNSNLSVEEIWDWQGDLVMLTSQY